LRLLLKHLGYYPYDKKATSEKHVFVKSIYLEAEEDGLWYCNVKPDNAVKKGQLLGRTEDFYGNVLHNYFISSSKKSVALISLMPSCVSGTSHSRAMTIFS